MQHSNEHKGLQKHSIGSDYPWSIKRIGNRYWQPFHCLTGEEGPRFYLSELPSYPLAETWIADRNQEQEQEAKQEQAPVLQEYTFLLPYDPCRNQGAFPQLESKLLTLFGGFSKCHNIFGQWVDDSGKTVDDYTVRYMVACPADKLDKLKTVVRWACKAWNQDCVYFAQSATAIEFLS